MCSATEEQREAARRLFYSSKLINQAIGDAISDMLIVEAILRLNKVPHLHVLDPLTLLCLSHCSGVA